MSVNGVSNSSAVQSDIISSWGRRERADRRGGANRSLGSFQPSFILPSISPSPPPPLLPPPLAGGWGGIEECVGVVGTDWNILHNSSSEHEPTDPALLPRCAWDYGKAPVPSVTFRVRFIETAEPALNVNHGSHPEASVLWAGGAELH